MNTNQKLLSEIVTYMKYSRYDEATHKRESWGEICARLSAMHEEQIDNRTNGMVKDFLMRKLDASIDAIENKQLLPSMRSLQFAGDAIKNDNVRMYNCSFIAISTLNDFWEVCYLLLCGCGVGYSVETHHTRNLPCITRQSEANTITYTIPDSKEGWADAFRQLILSYLFSGIPIEFDYSQIRPAGMPLKTSGGKAPGPKVIKTALENIGKLLKSIPVGDKLRPIHVHDIICFIGECVIAGGIRRSALISLFSLEDEEMFNCKTGNWYEVNPQRAMANNSVVLHRSEIDRDQFMGIANNIMRNGFGEPGIFWTNSPYMGTNPCAEIALVSKQFCNVLDMQASIIGSDSMQRICDLAAFMGTLQATYTDFPKLSKDWHTNSTQDALIGVGLTGLSKTWGSKDELRNMKKGAETIVTANEMYATMLGINPAKRTTTVKPAGSTSCVLGCSSGIHPYHSQHYIRRVSVDKKLGLYKQLSVSMPELIEDIDDTKAFFCIPIQAPANAMLREDVSAADLFLRVIDVNQHWIRNGDNVYLKGELSELDTHNYNNVSCSITYREEEIDLLCNLLWQYREGYMSVSMFPLDETVYHRPPHEAITEGQYNVLNGYVKELDFSTISEKEDFIHFESESACAGGNCEII